MTDADKLEHARALLEEIARACDDRGGGMGADELAGYVRGLASAALMAIEGEGDTTGPGRTPPTRRQAS